EIAARISHRLGGRIREPEAGRRAAADRAPDHDSRHLRHSLYDVQVFQMGVADPGERGDGSLWRAASAADHGDEFQCFFGRGFPGAIWSVGANRRNYAGIYQSTAGAALHD